MATDLILMKNSERRTLVQADCKIAIVLLLLCVLLAIISFFMNNINNLLLVALQ